MYNRTVYANSTNLKAPLPWYEHPECAVAPYGFVFYFGVKVFNFAMGAPCNILVIWQITTRKNDASTSDVFILNLALLDAYFSLMTPLDMVNRLVLHNDRIFYFVRFAYGMKDVGPLFLHIPSGVTTVIDIGDLADIFNLDAIPDTILSFIRLGTGTGRPRLQPPRAYIVCICVDRYMAVVHPVIFSTYRDSMFRICVSVLVWGLILAHALTKSILGALSVTDIFGGVILFAFAVMVYCNISIIWVLRRSVAGKEVMHPVKKKAFKIVLINLGIIVVNYLPPVALMPFVSYYTFVDYFCKISISVFSIMDLSCSIEPLLYITKMERVEGRCCRST